MARREIGCEPEWSFLDGTDEVHYGKLKEKPLRGIVDGGHRTFRTLYWFMDVGGDLRAGGRGWIDVTVVDAGGKPAPGRQVVRLTLRAPDGTERDESGLYAVRGTRRIPLRFARGETPGSLFSRWRVEAAELTSGLKEDVSFRLAD